MVETHNDAYERSRKIWDCSEDDERIPIWLDCDTGHDDAFAILLAGSCPRLNLLGVSTVHGNASLENTTRNTLSILKAIGRDDIQVYPGAAKPFCRDAVYAEAIHGSSGLDGTTLLPEPPSRPLPLYNTAINAMYTALSAQRPSTAWLISTGALTNSALLFATYPHLSTHIRGVSIMGGAIGSLFTHALLGRLPLSLAPTLHRTLPAGLPATLPPAAAAALLQHHGLLRGPSAALPAGPLAARVAAAAAPGNASAAAEFNIYVDPEAAGAVLGRGALARRATLVPLDVTHQVLATAAVARVVRGEGAKGAGAPASRLRALFAEILAFFAHTYECEFGMVEGPPLHDPLAVAAALWPALFDDNGGERFEVCVVKGDGKGAGGCEGGDGRQGECGRTVVRMLEKGAEGVRIPRTLDIDAFWCLIDLALGVAEGRGGMDFDK